MAITPPWEVKRQVVEKAIDETDPAYGCPPKERNLRQSLDYGLLNFDKPSGPTSHDVTAIVRRLIGASKAGHSGTLEGFQLRYEVNIPSFLLRRKEPGVILA
jgi:H/ACA ribonucleoprotein complex subunit 4